MKPKNTFASALAIASLACLAAPPAPARAAGADCEALRSQIEARIREAGVSRFSVETVDAATPVSGQIVGSCDLGTRKIVYTRNETPAPPMAPGGATPAPRAMGSKDRVLTECKDGRVLTSGGC